MSPGTAPRAGAKDLVRKIGLGTVQFGLDYGISNRDGATSPEEVGEILALAASRGLSLLDTAPAYGRSEQVIGEALPPGKAFRIVTKTPKLAELPRGADPAAAFAASLEESLRRLGASSVYGLLVHEADDLLRPGGQAVFHALREAKEKGLVRKIGASVYHPSQVRKLLDTFPIDIIQAPVNVFDQRLITSGLLDELKGAGVEVHARSVFLQGLLVMGPENLPPHFAPYAVRIRDYFARLESLGLSPVRAALAFVLSLEGVDSILCGVNNRKHLEEILSEAAAGSDFNRELAVFAAEDEALINPSRWRTGT